LIAVANNPQLSRRAPNRDVNYSCDTGAEKQGDFEGMQAYGKKEKR